MSESGKVHLAAPETPDTHGVNVYCPVEKEFTQFIVRKSTDGMEVEVCGACNEPEPEYRVVTDAELDAIDNQLYED
jgi:hypothetical protein